MEAKTQTQTQTKNLKVGQVYYYCGDHFSDAGNVIVLKYRTSSRYVPLVIKYEEEGKSFYAKCKHTLTSDRISVDAADLFVNKEQYLLSRIKELDNQIFELQKQEAFLTLQKREIIDEVTKL